MDTFQDRTSRHMWSRGSWLGGALVSAQSCVASLTCFCMAMLCSCLVLFALIFLTIPIHVMMYKTSVQQFRPGLPICFFLGSVVGVCCLLVCLVLLLFCFCLIFVWFFYFFAFEAFFPSVAADLALRLGPNSERSGKKVCKKYETLWLHNWGISWKHKQKTRTNKKRQQRRPAKFLALRRPMDCVSRPIHVVLHFFLRKFLRGQRRTSTPGGNAFFSYIAVDFALRLCSNNERSG